MFRRPRQSFSDLGHTVKRALCLTPILLHLRFGAAFPVWGVVRQWGNGSGSRKFY